MKSEKLVIEELSRMKSLFGYERGRVISEQVVPGTPNYGFTATPAVPIPQSLPTPETPRQQNINNAFCSVKGGVIVNPSSGQNGKQWSNYVSKFKVSAAEIAVAQKNVLIVKRRLKLQHQENQTQRLWNYKNSW